MARAAKKAGGSTGDVIPEADCRDFAIHPRLNHNLYGHSDAENAVLDAIKSERMHHAWLIQGPDGVGKATFSYRIARFLLSGGENRDAESLDVDEDNVASRQIGAHAHPDLFILRREWARERKKLRQTIAVDDVRKAINFFNHTSGAGGWRIAIVDSMDDLNRNGANALLKTLEEPPERALFLLVCSSPGMLPATIHSRCRSLVLSPLNDDDMISALSVGAEKNILDDLSSTDKISLLELAAGSPGQAIELVSGNGLTINQDIVKILAELPTLDYARLHALAGRLGRLGAEKDFALTIELLRTWISNRVVSPTNNSVIARYAPLAIAWEKIDHLYGRAAALNLDRRRAVLEAFNIIATHYNR